MPVVQGPYGLRCEPVLDFLANQVCRSTCPTQRTTKGGFSAIPVIGLQSLFSSNGVLHFLATQYLRTKGIKPQFPNGIVNSVSFVSTTNTARSLAGFVSLALALTTWRSPGSSEKLCLAS